MDIFVRPEIIELPQQYEKKYENIPLVVNTRYNICRFHQDEVLTRTEELQ